MKGAPFEALRGGVWSGSPVGSRKVPRGPSDHGVRWGRVASSGLRGQDGAQLFSGSLAKFDKFPSLLTCVYRSGVLGCLWGGEKKNLALKTLFEIITVAVFHVSYL